MGFIRPTLRTLFTRAKNDINGRIKEGDARLSVGVLNVLAAVHSGATDGLYGYLDQMSQQLLPDRCTEEYLARWATIYKVPRILAAPATGPATIQSAVDVPAGRLFQRQDGAQYRVSATAVPVGGVVTMSLVAIVCGVAGNTETGTSLSIIESLSGSDSSATVIGDGLGGGADIEDIASWRRRLMNRIQQPPKAGAKNDYEVWALEVPGVTRAWCSPAELGNGTVTVRFMRDGDTDPIPDGAAVDAVKAHINELKPVTAELFVVAPIAAPVNFQIQAISPNTAAVRQAIVAELQDLFRREAIPGGTILITHIRAAISSAAGEYDHVLLSPAANVINAIGAISTLGAIVWT